MGYQPKEDDLLKRVKSYNFKAAVVMGVGVAFTSPVIRVYMIQQINVDFFKIVVLIEQFLAFVSFFVLQKKDVSGNPTYLHLFRANFALIVIVDIMSLIIANVIGVNCPEARFIVITILDGFSSVIWFTVIQDIFNQVISGTDLTLFNAKVSKLERFGALCGALLLLAVDIDINTALFIQILTYAYLGYCDLRIYYALRGK